MSIALLRNRAGNTLPEAERLLSETDGHYELLTEVNTVIKKYYASELNSAELDELSRHILKSKYIKASDYANDYSIEIDQYVFKLIFTFSQHYGVDLSKDGELFEGLITHLRPLILNQHTLGYEQDIMEEIKSEFSNVYENVEGSLDMLDIPFAEEVIRHEVPFITVHFAAALQRNSLETQMNKRILIVCSQGIGVSKLLEQRLTNYFNAEVIDVIPFHYLEHYPRLQSVDLIVTTIGIEKPPMELPAVKVNAVLTSQDLNNLEKEGIIRRNRKIELSKLVDLISPNLKTSINDELVEALKSHFGSFIVDDLSGSKQNDSRQIKKEFIQVVESVFKLGGSDSNSPDSFRGRQLHY
ncbi:MAG: PRD domain-containing protein [Alkalibacterium sp.]|nr:PRD domain-containing protein [Alkalibacterium sp.]